MRLGFPVTYSSIYNEYANIFIPRLNIPDSSWAPKYLDQNQWIQVGSPVSLKWIGVATQGRPDVAQWVTRYRVSYSLDGINWSSVDSGRIFVGNSNQNTIVRNNFNTAVVARAIRL